MKIEKVNENQIRCTLTREDLASRELKISELAYGTEKAKTLFRDMMQQANYEFGFEAEDIPLMIEAIPLNAECIVLIITKVEDPEELDTRFSRFSPSVTVDEDSGEDRADASPEEMMDLFRRIQEKRKTATAEPAVPASESAPAPQPLPRVFALDSLRQVMDAAAVSGARYQGESSLYKDERTGKYLLVLAQGDESTENFDRVSNIISEYGTLRRTLPASRSFLEEHYEALIPSHALAALGTVQ